MGSAIIPRPPDGASGARRRSAAGLDLEDVTVTQAGKRRLLRVIVDGDGGVSLDDVAEVSRAVSAALDADDAMGASPVRAGGLLARRRPPAHRATPLAPRGQRLVKADAARRHRRSRAGSLAADDDGVDLDVDGSDRAASTIRTWPGTGAGGVPPLDDADDGEDGDEG